MRHFSWKIAKTINKFKRGLRKLKKRIKNILKSNKYTLVVCRKIKAVLNGENGHSLEVNNVNEIVYRICPKAEWQKQRDTVFQKDITFSILVPLYNTPERYLREMIESVQYQSYTKWELCLADGSDPVHSQVGDICREYVRNDSRIKYEKLKENKGISGNTNACIDMATGNYLALFDHDDFLHPSVLYENAKVICETDADYLYTDEAIFKGDNIFNIVTKHYKPDFSIDNLRANNYICHFSVFSAELLQRTGKFKSEFDGSQDHDLILRLTEVAARIYHIPKILYYWRSHPESVASDILTKTYAIDAAKSAVRAHLDRTGISAEVESSIVFPTFFRLKYNLQSLPKVSIIISGADNAKTLKRCIASIVNKSTYNNYEIIVTESGNFHKYDVLKKDLPIKFIKCDGEYNNSQICNYCAEHASGDYLILLSGCADIISENWIEELLMYAQREDVAVVGAKIYYPDDTIYHAGVVIGAGKERIAAYSYQGAEKDNEGYMGNLFYSRNVSALSGACMMVKTSIYKELGGFDEQFTFAYNDIDFCLKARERGYLNIFTPYSELYNYSFSTVCNKNQYSESFKKDAELFSTKWIKLVSKGDPYYNHNFSLDKADYTVSE